MIMSKQCLDVQQMHHLKELGLDTANASMYWISYNGINVSIPSNFHLPTNDNDYVICNAYTLQDVLDLLPKQIGVEYIYDLCIFPESISYTQFIGGEINDNLFEVPINESLIDAAYSLLCWAIENGYVETNKTSET